MKKLKKEGDVNAFNNNWMNRKESTYTHWTRGKIKNQIQLAFRNHWLLFSELIAEEKKFNGGKKALEVGCGRGSLSCYFSDKGYDCTLFEKKNNILNGASTNNLNRVHFGYHYPRDYETAKQSTKGYITFKTFKTI